RDASSGPRKAQQFPSIYRHDGFPLRTQQCVPLWLSRATKKLSRCFTIYRPSDISREDCFSSWPQNHVQRWIQKNVVDLLKMSAEIGDFVCSQYFDHFAHPPPRKFAKSQIRCYVNSRATTANFAYC